MKKSTKPTDPTTLPTSEEIKCVFTILNTQLNRILLTIVFHIIQILKVIQNLIEQITIFINDFF